MNLFFGKVSTKFDINQIKEGYYISDKGSSWFGGIEPGDYTYLIGNGKIQFWKAREWGKKGERECLYFDIINDNLGIKVNRFIALKFFDLTKEFVVLSSRSARNRAFFKLDWPADLSVEYLSSSETYKDKSIYRKVLIHNSEKELQEGSKDIQFYYEGSSLKLYPADFISEAVQQNFRDNFVYAGRGRKFKDNTFKRLRSKPSNPTATFSHNEISIRSLYDALFCDYEVDTTYYLVGSYWNDTNPKDQTERFIREGIWENGYYEKFLSDVNAIPEGSQIAIKTTDKRYDNMYIKAIGEVVKNYKDGRKLDVEWEEDFNEFKVNFTGGYWSTIHEVTNTDHIQAIWERDVDEFTEENDLFMNRLRSCIDLLINKKQIILQGPPGTGKTYLAKKIAQKMTGDTQDKQWKLVQFHPSFTYEDFVRGITVSSDTQAKLVYESKNKVLAEFAEEALSNVKEVNKDQKQLSKEQQIEKLLAEFAGIIAEEIVENEVYKITDAVSIIEVEEDAFRYSGTWKVSQRMKFKDLVIAQLREVTTRQGLLDIEEVSGLAKHHASYFIKVFNKFQEKYGTRLNQIVEAPIMRPTLKNYVLVIDEINRANLPAVLGELIYALEYRNEAVESMYAVDGDTHIILPENLYIIGTMNTADRSVGQIDYAIRRRFAFVDVLPNREVIELDKAKELFDKVAALFKSEGEAPGESYLAPDFDAKDVQLGHSYFMAKDEAELKIRWKYEILPILREYVKDGLLLESANDKINELEKFI